MLWRLEPGDIFRGWWGCLTYAGSQSELFIEEEEKEEKEETEEEEKEVEEEGDREW